MMGLLSFLLGKSKNDDLAKALSAGAFLVDVRTRGEFSGGSAEGAVNIPLNELRSNLSKFKGKGNIVVFCRSGARSGEAKKILEQNGIQNVLNGGSWKNVRDSQ